jgi:hypothetical protein
MDTWRVDCTAALILTVLGSVSTRRSAIVTASCNDFAPFNPRNVAYLNLRNGRSSHSLLNLMFTRRPIIALPKVSRHTP